MKILDTCTAALAALLSGWRLTSPAAEPLARLMALLVPVYALCILLYWTGRLTKVVKPTVNTVERLLEPVAAILLTAEAAAIVLAVRFWPQVSQYVTSSSFWIFKEPWWQDTSRYSDAFLTVFILFASLAVLIGLPIAMGKYILTMVRYEIKDHGPALGIVLAIYDFFAGPFLLSLVLLIWALIVH